MVGQEKVYETLAALEIEFVYTEHPAAPTICFSGITKGIAIIW